MDVGDEGGGYSGSQHSRSGNSLAVAKLTLASSHTRRQEHIPSASSGRLHRPLTSVQAHDYREIGERRIGARNMTVDGDEVRRPCCWSDNKPVRHHEVRRPLRRPKAGGVAASTSRATRERTRTIPFTIPLFSKLIFWVRLQHFIKCILSSVIVPQFTTFMNDANANDAD